MLHGDTVVIAYELSNKNMKIIGHYVQRGVIFVVSYQDASGNVFLLLLSSATKAS